MDNTTYIDIIKNGERVDWYGVNVPKDLLTNLVITWSTGLKKEIDKFFRQKKKLYRWFNKEFTKRPIFIKW